jgi:hypothetical protein
MSARASASAARAFAIGAMNSWWNECFLLLCVGGAFGRGTVTLNGDKSGQ